MTYIYENLVNKKFSSVVTLKVCIFFLIFNFNETHPGTVHIFQKEQIFQYRRQHLPVQQETSQVAVEELSKDISIRAQTIPGNQLEKQVIVALRKLSAMNDVGRKQSYSSVEMFT